MNKSVYMSFPVEESSILSSGQDIETCNIIMQNKVYHKNLRQKSILDDAVEDKENNLTL